MPSACARCERASRSAARCGARVRARARPPRDRARAGERPSTYSRTRKNEPSSSLPKSVAARDVRVLDVRRGHRLALEARDDLGHAAHLGVKHLHREALAHVRVLGLVDRAHPPLADEPLDQVAPAEASCRRATVAPPGPLARPLLAAPARRPLRRGGVAARAGSSSGGRGSTLLSGWTPTPTVRKSPNVSLPVRRPMPSCSVWATAGRPLGSY